MNFYEMFRGLGVFFQNLFNSLSELMEWLLTPSTLGEYEIAPIYFIGGGMLIIAVTLAIVSRW